MHIKVDKELLNKLSEDGEGGSYSAGVKKTLEAATGRTLSAIIESVNETEPLPGVDIEGKKRSDISAEEKAELFNEWREQGKQPREEWEKIPYE